MSTKVERIPQLAAIERPSRRPKERFLKLEGREHKAEGWTDSFLYIDNAKFGEAVSFTRSTGTSLTCPDKINHLNCVSLADCTIRARRGVISG